MSKLHDPQQLLLDDENTALPFAPEIEDAMNDFAARAN